MIFNNIRWHHSEGREFVQTGWQEPCGCFCHTVPVQVSSRGSFLCAQEIPEKWSYLVSQVLVHIRCRQWRYAHRVSALIVGQDLRDLPASWGQVADGDPLTLRLRAEERRQQSRGIVLRRPHMTLLLFFSFNFLSKLFLHLIFLLKLQTEFIWCRTRKHPHRSPKFIQMKVYLNLPCFRERSWDVI